MRRERDERFEEGSGREGWRSGGTRRWGEPRFDWDRDEQLRRFEGQRHQDEWSQRDYGNPSGEYGRRGEESGRSPGGPYGREMGERGWGGYGGGEPRAHEWRRHGEESGDWGGLRSEQLPEGYGPRHTSWPAGQRPMTSSQGYGPETFSSHAAPASGSSSTSTGEPRRGKPPRGYQKSDDRIREEICDLIVRDSDIDASDVEIAVNGGEVTLTGSVEERRDKWELEELSERVYGVKDVNNQLKVRKGFLARMGEKIDEVFSGDQPQSGGSPRGGTTTRRS